MEAKAKKRWDIAYTYDSVYYPATVHRSTSGSQTQL